MKALFVAGLLSVVVPGGAWLLMNELPAPDDPDRPDDQIPPFIAADSSGNGNDGIIEGDAVMGLPGRFGTSYTFVNDGSWIQVPSVPEIDPGIRDFLVSVWVQFDEFPDPGETYDVVRKGVAYTAPGEFKLEVLPGGRVRCTATGSSGTAALTSIPAIPDDEDWHQIGCARTGAFWSVLIDDTSQTRSVTLGAVSNTVPLAIGSKYGLEDRPPCRVDEVKLFIDQPSDDPLPTEPDVPAAILALEQEDPAGWWSLDESAPSATGR